MRPASNECGRTLASIRSGDDSVLYVRHDRDGSWELLPEDHLSRAAEPRETMPFESLIASDARLAELLDLPRGHHAWRETPAGAWHREEIPTGATYWFRFEAVPRADHPRAAELAGAFPTCWVRDRSLPAARERARQAIASEGWRIIDEEDAYEVERGQLDPASVTYFDQVQIDGLVCVIHEYESRDDAATE